MITDLWSWTLTRSGCQPYLWGGTRILSRDSHDPYGKAVLEKGYFVREGILAYEVGIDFMPTSIQSSVIDVALDDAMGRGTSWAAGLSQ